MSLDPDYLIHDASALEALYGRPSEASLLKEQDHLTPEYRALIEASPFMVLATAGPDGLDASPRGDSPAVVTVEDETTLMIPDRHGNNRVDSLRNIVADRRVGLLFLIPGLGHTLRVNGIALISVDPVLLARFTVAGKAPRSVIVIKIETVYFQCSRAVIRSGLWDPARHAAAASLPTAGDILAACTQGAFDGKSYDATWPEKAKASLF